MTTDNRTNEQIVAEALREGVHVAGGGRSHLAAADVTYALGKAGRLVAAQDAAPQITGRRPKRLLNQLNRIADALEEYEFEGAAADAPAWMRKAAEYIESERQWHAPVLPSSDVDEDALAEVEAERDAALAAIERVAKKIEAVAGGTTTSSEAAGYRNGLLRAAQIVRAALDGGGEE